MEQNTQNTNSNRTKRTKNDKKRFLETFVKKGCHISKTCKAANVGRRTYYEWLAADEEFVDAVDDARESLNDDTEDALMTAINDGNVAAIIFRLKTKCRDRGYDEKQQIELIKPFDRIDLENID
tara:strand:+ start:161 stop:532 length:372 start_codon:yes stop_codon:yes gene_type:complete